MKLTLLGHDHRYAVEQTALMLLPGVKVVYDGEEPDQGTVTLLENAQTARAEFTLNGKTNVGEAHRSELGLDTPLTEKGIQQRLVKLATYRALSQFTGIGPWGALSGVRPAKLAAQWLSRGADSLQVHRLLTGLYDLSPEKSTLTIRCGQIHKWVEDQMDPNDISLYIGVPFCPTRCAYCSFISSDVKGSMALMEPYVEELCREILWAGEYLQKRNLRVRSVYMGGGTPTTLSAQQLRQVLSALTSWLDFRCLMEFTVEAGRPDTITAEKLEVLREFHVGRISVNPQTLSDQVLQAIGRAHTAQQFKDALSLAQTFGFDSINCDLIAGLPKDSPAGFQATLEELLSLGPDEVTVHTLALKHGSTLLNNPQSQPSGEEVSQMLSTARQALTDHGFSPYYLYRQKYMTGAMENVGWSKNPTPGIYNVVMMEEITSVLALGAGGVTKWVNRQTGHIDRQTNPKFAREYLTELDRTIAQREAYLPR